jgi:hypothetical protein
LSFECRPSGVSSASARLSLVHVHWPAHLRHKLQSCFGIHLIFQFIKTSGSLSYPLILVDAERKVLKPTPIFARTVTVPPVLGANPILSRVDKRMQPVAGEPQCAETMRGPHGARSALSFVSIHSVHGWVFKGISAETRRKRFDLGNLKILGKFCTFHFSGLFLSSFSRAELS